MVQSLLEIAECDINIQASFNFYWRALCLQMPGALMRCSQRTYLEYIKDIKTGENQGLLNILIRLRKVVF